MEKAKVFGEIIDYCEENDEVSYYNMKAYAAKNKPEWIECLKDRNFAKSVAEYLKSKKHSENKVYKESFAESYGGFIKSTKEKI